MLRIVCPIGTIYGRAKVIGEAPQQMVISPDTGKLKKGATQSVLECSCSTIFTARNADLASGNTKSCGCLVAELVKVVNKTHGHTSNGFASKTYHSWQAMHARCNNPKSKYWKHYGGRGIIICERWSYFENFLTDKGERPKGKTLGRIDNNLNYTPENTRWETTLQQVRNSRHNHILTIRGITACMTELCERFGVPYGRVQGRIQRGWEPETAFFAPRYFHA